MHQHHHLNHPPTCFHLHLTHSLQKIIMHFTLLTQVRTLTVSCSDNYVDALFNKLFMKLHDSFIKGSSCNLQLSQIKLKLHDSKVNDLKKETWTIYEYYDIYQKYTPYPSPDISRIHVNLFHFSSSFIIITVQLIIIITIKNITHSTFVTTPYATHKHNWFTTTKALMSIK